MASILQKWGFTDSLFYIIVNLTFLVLESGQLQWVFFSFFYILCTKQLSEIYTVCCSPNYCVEYSTYICDISFTEKAPKTKTNKNKTIKKNIYSLSILRTVIQMLHFCIRVCRWETSEETSLRSSGKRPKYVGREVELKTKYWTILFSHKNLFSNAAAFTDLSSLQSVIRQKW